jgi:hypothetical protein
MDLTQAFSLLKSLQQNLPNEFAVEKKWVDDFHSILDGGLAVDDQEVVPGSERLMGGW